MRINTPSPHTRKLLSVPGTKLSIKGRDEFEIEINKVSASLVEMIYFNYKSNINGYTATFTGFIFLKEKGNLKPKQNEVIIDFCLDDPPMKVKLTDIKILP